ncbi:MAG: AIR synthase-related protein [Alphaproteobacteria bacterium]
MAAGNRRHPEDDIRRTFNLGIGMVAIAEKTEADAIIASLKQAGEEAAVIGDVA